MTYTHIDCFSGPGGICTGFRAAGFETLAAIEMIKSCVDTYRANHPNVNIINADIRDVGVDQIFPLLPSEGADIVTSGMPCETFSTAGKTSRSFYDDRCFLFREGIRIAKIANAKMLLIENVPAITSKRVSKTSPVLIVDVLKEELAKSGYGNLIEVVLNSADFGVPQRRKRYFVLACRFPNWVLAGPGFRWNNDVTVSEALAGLPNVVPNSNEEGKHYTDESNQYVELMRDNGFWKLNGGAKCADVTCQMPMNHRAATLERFSLLGPGEGLKDLFNRYVGKEREELQSRRVLPKKMFIKRNLRLLLEDTSPTLTSHCLDEFVHPVHDRALTVRECARLQSFPDSYDFAGGPYIVPHINKEVQDKYEQIGDAVPPLLAYEWGRTITKILEAGANA